MIMRWRWYWLCVGRRWCDVAMFFASQTNRFVYLLAGGWFAFICWRNYEFQPGISCRWYRTASYLGSVSYITVFWILGGNIAIGFAEDWELFGRTLDKFRNPHTGEF